MRTFKDMGLIILRLGEVPIIGPFLYNPLHINGCWHGCHMSNTLNYSTRASGAYSLILTVKRIIHI